jgi:all-trans-retinol 13,14-reductase
MVVGEEAQKQKLKDKFPEEAEAIDKYFGYVKEANHAFNRSFNVKLMPLPLATMLTWTRLHNLFDGGYGKWASKSLAEVLNGLTKNKELQAVLAANYGDYGTDPSRAPFVMHAVVCSAYLDGAFYPRGGPSTIPNKIIKQINDCGGKVLVRARVKRILLDNKKKKATGVEMADGTTIHSGIVISDVGLVNTATKLLPRGLIDIDFTKDDKDNHALHPAPTAISLYVGLDEDHRSLNLPDDVYFIHSSNDLVGNVEKLRTMSLEDALKGDSVSEALEGDSSHLGPIFVNCPSANDKNWTSEFPGKSVLEIIAFGPWSWFEKFESTFNSQTQSHGQEYESAKLLLAQKMWTRVVEVLENRCPTLPKTLDNVDHFRIGTPLTYSHFLHSEHGALYGLDHDLKRFEPTTHYLRLRPKVQEVSGLYLSGQDVTTCGFIGAMFGGLLCAGNVLDKGDPLTLLREQEKKTESDKETKQEGNMLTPSDEDETAPASLLASRK